MAPRREQKYLYAVRNRNLPGNPPSHHRHDTIRAVSENFIIAIGGPLNKHSIEAQLVEQQKNRQNQPMLVFQSRGAVRIAQQHVLISLPINCSEQEGRFRIEEEDFRRIVLQIRMITSHQESDDSEYDRYSESHQHINSVDHCYRGRPRGSKNRLKESVQKSSEEEGMEQSVKKQEKRGRGRPKGAKNIKKQTIVGVEGSLVELGVEELLVSLFESKSVQEVTTRMNRLRERDDRQLMVKKEEIEGDEMIKRSRGRPKGVKNKPKLTNEQSESEQTIQTDNLPKKRANKGQFLGQCCTTCQEREVKLQLLQGRKVNLSALRNLTQRIGVECKDNVLLAVLRSGDIESLKELLPILDRKGCEFGSGWEVESRLQECYYTVRTRKELVYKGRRQGVNALLQDGLRPGEGSWWRGLGIEKVLEAIPCSQEGIQMWKLLVDLDNDLRRQSFLNIASVIRVGNEVLGSYLLQIALKEEQNSTCFGYARQHWQCLQKGRIEMQFKKSAMLKQCFTANFCSPIHCATINSNTQLLSFILKHISGTSVGDSLNRKPIHYAATLPHTTALQLLLKHGAQPMDMDKKKTTPLMLAAQFGRTASVKLLLQRVRESQYINFRGEEGLAALHYACVEGHKDIVELMLGDSLVQPMARTKQGMTLFHLLAGTGQIELIDRLVSQELNPEQYDNFRRTPLMIAIRNNQNQVFFYLFHSLQCYFRRDYSYNTLLHYAAAYGNIEVVSYFMAIGARQTMNRRSFYPFQVAVLKGHYSCARKLENWSLHLSHHLLNRLSRHPRPTQEYYTMYEYLLSTRKYDLNYRNPNAHGQTCLHFVCALSHHDYRLMRVKECSEVKEEQYDEMMDRLISLLLQYGADPQVQNDRGEKPLRLCIQNQNIVGIQLLLRTIPFELQPANRHNNYVYYLTNIAVLGWAQMKFVCDRLMATEEKTLRQQLKKVDINGFSFLLYLVKRFTETVHANFRNKYAHFLTQEKQKEGQKDEVVIENAILGAFEEYKQHEQHLIKLVNYLVELGCDPRFIVSAPRMEEEHQNYKKWGVQHFLMRFPSPHLLRMFMKWIDVHFNLQNSQGRTPLHLFCLWNDEGCLFNNNCPQSDPLPPIILPQLASFTGTACLEYLLEHGLTANVLDINRSTPLLYAAARGQLAFIRLLRTCGSTINNVNSLNQVPLIELLKQPCPITLAQLDSILSDEGVKPDFRDNNGRNALHHLVSIAKNFDHSPQFARRLLERGIDVNSLDKFGRSPLFYCFIRIEEGEGGECGNDKVQILQALLTHPHINTNIVDMYQRTALHYACERHFFFSVLYLLEKQVDHHVVDVEGNTPLAICLRNRNLNQAAMLIRQGVKEGQVVEEGTVYSYISYAARKLSLGMCYILIDHGYPLEKALEEADQHKQALAKRYDK